MNPTLSICGLALALLLPLAARAEAAVAASSPGQELDAAARVLEARAGVPVSGAVTSTLEALVKSIDPGATWVDAAAPTSSVPTRPVVEAAEKWPRDLAYLKLNGLYGDAAGPEVVSLLRGWEDSGRAGFILDLRGAGGDSLAAAATVAGLFARSGRHLFTLRSRAGQDLASYRATGGEPLRMPAMVLVDAATAGAAEALAASLADNGRWALVLGQPTAGDPLIREPVELPGGRVVRLATRELVTAAGVRHDGRVGVRPEVLVAHPGRVLDFYEAEDAPDRRATLEEEREDRKLRDRVRGDLVLQRAVDLLVATRALNLPAGRVLSEVSGRPRE